MAANEIRGANSAAVADESQQDTAPPAVKVGFLQRFTILLSAAPELWIVFALKFFAILSWSLMNRTIPFWLRSDLGYADVSAGSVIMTWSAVMTLVTVLVGSFTDAVGLRRTFLLGAGVCMAARLVMVSSIHPVLALGFGMLPVAVGEALLGPVMVAATKRYATTAQRSIAFSIVYAVMNLAFLVAAKIFDYARRNLGERAEHDVLGFTLSTYEILMLLSVGAMAPVLVLSFMMRKGVEVTDAGVVVTPEVPKYPGVGLLSASWLTMRDAFHDTVRIFIGLWGQSGFIRFLVFLLFATFMRMIFFHTSYTLAPMAVRELGPGSPVGGLDAINSLLIIFLVPIVGAMTQRVSAYKMVVTGCIMGATSVFIMALPVETYRPLAEGAFGKALGWWLGLGTGATLHPWYVSIALFYIAVSFGEAFYSPRLYEYAAVIAPKGQEASYMALSYLPFFGAKLTVGFLSGILLAKFCPEDGQRNSEMLWVIIGCITLVAPVGLLTFRRYIKVQESGRSE